MLILAILGTVLGLPLIGAVLGLLQLAYYRAMRVPADDVPFFLILMLRGMVVGFALIAAITIIAHLLQPR